jgi:N-acyl-D-amino-acid deacylase
MKRILPVFFVLFAHVAMTQDYDLVIINGKLIDGTGNSWRYADIAITNGKISGIGNLKQASSKHVIDAKKPCHCSRIY